MSPPLYATISCHKRDRRPSASSRAVVARAIARALSILPLDSNAAYEQASRLWNKNPIEDVCPNEVESSTTSGVFVNYTNISKGADIDVELCDIDAYTVMFDKGRVYINRQAPSEVLCAFKYCPFVGFGSLSVS